MDRSVTQEDNTLKRLAVMAGWCLEITQNKDCACKHQAPLVKHKPLPHQALSAVIVDRERLQYSSCVA